APPVTSAPSSPASSVQYGRAHQGPAVPAPAGLALTPCQLEHPERISSVTAECGVLSVAENPARPEGRRIGLYVARVPAINKHKSADPGWRRPPSTPPSLRRSREFIAIATSCSSISGARVARMP